MVGILVGRCIWIMARWMFGEYRSILLLLCFMVYAVALCWMFFHCCCCGMVA